MIKLLIISLLLIVGCKENTKASKIDSYTRSEKSLLQEKKTKKDWSGKWIYSKKTENSDVPEEQFTLTILQDGENISAQYCAIANSGRKIDCTNEKEYNVIGKIVNDKIIGNFYSFFGSSKNKGRVEISFVDDNTINWEIISSPKGLFYAPDRCSLKREDSKSNISIKDKVIFPLKNTNIDNLDWEDNNRFTNYNFTYDLPEYQNSSVILAKNDMSDDIFYTLFILNKRKQITDSLKISYVEDGYPENDSRQITEFIINPNYQITLDKFKRKNYDKILVQSLNYTISNTGKFVKIANSKDANK